MNNATASSHERDLRIAGKAMTIDIDLVAVAAHGAVAVEDGEARDDLIRFLGEHDIGA